MKQSIFKAAGAFTSLLLMLITTTVFAQDKIEVDTGEVKSWLEQNWMWVAGGVVLLILIIALGRGNRTNRVRGTKRTTTVVKDPAGHTRSVTTTEEKI